VFKEKELTESTPDAELIDLIVEFPTLLERPIVEYGSKAVIARPIEKGIRLVKGP
jgi:arsenate reductase